MESYKAYLMTDQGWIRVYPKSKKLSRFNTLQDAEKRLTMVASSLRTSPRGVITPGMYSPQAPGFDWNKARTIQF